jgi:tetratricopeptide (TPR) repeat protein
LFLCSLFILTAPLLRGADDISSILAADGKSIDLQKMTQFTDWVAPHISYYPTDFADDAQKQRILSATQKVTDEILKTDVAQMKDAETLTTLGYILAMGHNVELHTAQKARECFDRALTLDPESRRANWLYGSFLASTGIWHFDSLPYLQKALGLGERDAQFTIAMLYYQKGDKSKAIEELSAYTNAKPDDMKASKILDTMKHGRLGFDAVPLGGTPPKVGDKAPESK